MECTVSGTQNIYPTAVFVTEDEPSQGVARFYGSGSLLGIQLSHIGVSDGARTRAEIRVPGSGPGFVLRGLLELRELDIYLRRDLPIVPGHAWLTRGARVELRGGGPPGTARVRASYGAFHELHADAPCDALGLEVPVGSRSRRPTPSPAPSGYAHIAHAGVVLRDDTGAPLLRLGNEGMGATVRLLETRGDLRRVLYDDDVRLDGYLQAGELLPGEGPDCDDCHGSIRDSNDRCPDEPTSDEDGCPTGPLQLARAKREVDIHLHPRPDSPIIGRIEPGVEVVVVEPKKGSASSLFADVRPRHGALEPVTGFFVERAALLFTQTGSSGSSKQVPSVQIVANCKVHGPIAGLADNSPRRCRRAITVPAWVFRIPSAFGSPPSRYSYNLQWRGLASGSSGLVVCSRDLSLSNGLEPRPLLLRGRRGRQLG